MGSSTDSGDGQSQLILRYEHTRPPRGQKSPFLSFGPIGATGLDLAEDGHWRGTAARMLAMGKDRLLPRPVAVQTNRASSHDSDSIRQAAT